MGNSRKRRPKGRTRQGSSNFLRRVLENSVAKIIANYVRDGIDWLLIL